MYDTVVKNYVSLVLLFHFAEFGQIISTTSVLKVS